MGAVHETVKSSIGVASMGVMRPEFVIKSIVHVVMAGVLRFYGLIIVVIISTGINPKAKSYYLFDGYTHPLSGLSCGFAGLAVGMVIGIVGNAGVSKQDISDYIKEVHMISFTQVDKIITNTTDEGKKKRRRRRNEGEMEFKYLCKIA
ncbi:V-type proton ATPase subunit c1-like protein [Cinnamomum micranthum f. kanehirae]|uniref:V-type proton ATPase proteolipid subunit n=1 Tax=Cinnamomum micranthum f. kanehirae TaxID=337451 RepID=A0A443NXI2_9MAGN|nr:V-type proton ATPase subunit c1-like protein [Cinnamomum micranthum f. kanehirae]